MPLLAVLYGHYRGAQTSITGHKPKQKTPGCSQAQTSITFSKRQFTEMHNAKVTDNSVLRKQKSAKANRGVKLDGKMLAVSKTPTFTTLEQPKKAKLNLKNQLITMDWLDLKIKDGFSGKVSLEFAKNKGWYILKEGGQAKYSLEVAHGGGISYGKSANVYFYREVDKSEKIGMLYWDAKFKEIKNTAKLHIDNKLFYNQLGNTLTVDLIDRFVSLLGSKVIGVIRVDIALDSTKYGDLAKKVHSGEITPVKQDSLHHTYSKMRYGQKKELGFNFGSREYGRYIRVYNKSEELRNPKNDNKSKYIHEFWLNNGLNDAKEDVFRIEFELKHNYLKSAKKESIGKSDPIVWTDLFDSAKQLEIVEMAQRNFFEFVPSSVLDRRIKNYTAERVKAAQKRLQRAKENGKCVKIIDFEKIKHDCYIRTIDKEPKTVNRSVQIAVKQLLGLAALTPDKEHEKALNYVMAACQMMDDFELKNYINYKSYQWKQDFKNKSQAKGKGAINKIFGKYDNFAQFMCEVRDIDFEVSKYAVNSKAIEENEAIETVHNLFVGASYCRSQEYC